MKSLIRTRLRRRTKIKSNHEGHEEHKEKIECMTLRFLCELRALRGETSFFIKCKEFTIKTLIVWQDK